MVYLSQGLGAAMGLAGSSAVYQAGLRSTLDSRLIQLHLDTDMRNEVNIFLTPSPPLVHQVIIENMSWFTDA